MGGLASKKEQHLSYPTEFEDHVRGTLYGNAIGDTIGLLTEFMKKKDAILYYGKYKKLEYGQKVPDMHRERWAVGDWTDDTDQMILIMLSLLETDGEPDCIDFGIRLLDWAHNGFPELGDKGGMGIGATTSKVLRHEKYRQNPHEAAQAVWENTGCHVAPNGGVMRTSVLGVYKYDNLDAVFENTLEFCKTTHADPRCQASCVAVSCAIALMLQRGKQHLNDDGSYNIKAIQDDCFQQALKCLPENQPDSEQYNELKKYIYVTDLEELELDEHGKIGYTYKCLGAGFWALQQNNFRKALQALVMQGGDADTNGAVAGALLGCKLGAHALPWTWVIHLKHRKWFDKIIARFLYLSFPDKFPNPDPEPPKMLEEEEEEEKEEDSMTKDEVKTAQAEEDQDSSKVDDDEKKESKEES